MIVSVNMKSIPVDKRTKVMVEELFEALDGYAPEVALFDCTADGTPRVIKKSVTTPKELMTIASERFISPVMCVLDPGGAMTAFIVDGKHLCQEHSNSMYFSHNVLMLEADDLIMFKLTKGDIIRKVLSIAEVCEMLENPDEWTNVWHYVSYCCKNS